jgi:phosphatidylglycerol:prolipoprotein diacylglycerol transferase
VQPVLFEFFGIHVTGYGVTKALAALAAGYFLAREFRRLRWDPDHAWNLVLAASILGFAGGKLYYVAEHLPDVTAHHWGPAGFTWYGGLIAGVITVLAMARHYRLPIQQLAGVAAAPLSLAYAIGRVGCFLAGDGSYGKPSDLPWAVAFPNGMVPTLVPVHPTALYEAVFAFLLAGFLWAIRTRFDPQRVFGAYAVLSGGARFLVEELRLNKEVLLGLTQPQVWSILLVAVGVWLLLRTPTRSRESGGSIRDKVPAVTDAA